jgi:hypothetical protein
LKAGWDEGLFATSYELKFVNKNKSNKNKSVCVNIWGGTFVHCRPCSDTDCCVSHITNVHSNEVKTVRISVLNYGLKLKDVLAEITVFRQVLRNRDKGGLVLATKIDTSQVDEPEDEWVLFDLGADYNWETKIKKENWKAVDTKQEPEVVNASPGLLDETYVITIGRARARVCGHPGDTNQKSSRHQ